MTSVINVRTAKDPAEFLYVGRRCKHIRFGWLKASPFANPYKVAHGADESMKRACLDLYRSWLRNTLNSDGVLRRHLRMLTHGITDPALGCWCGAWSPGEPELLCHAVILAKTIDLDLANGGQGEEPVVVPDGE